MSADIEVPDRGERVSLMEPLVIGQAAAGRAGLVDLALELARKSAGFERSVPREMLAPLARLVRSMNCYYSNLIEGHNTHPIEIERALRSDYSQDAHKRDLQLEALAHIEVQQWIDGGGLRTGVETKEALIEIHRRFYERLPESLCWVENLKTGERLRVEAGRIRRQDVAVGGHVAVSPGAVGRFLIRFAEVYGGLGRAERILAVAAAHHRFLWIHPFLDGNGRVARLMSHAMLLESLEAAGVWSVARGLARRVTLYRDHLANCDGPRRNDLDGRGTLSEGALTEFTRFFLETCIDQVEFMESLIEPARLRARVLLWAEEEARLGELPAGAVRILEALLYRGALARGEAAAASGSGDRHTRRIVAALRSKGVVDAEDPRGPLRLRFPPELAGRWVPGLFPEQSS